MSGSLHGELGRCEFVYSGGKCWELNLDQCTSHVLYLRGRCLGQ